MCAIFLVVLPPSSSRCTQSPREACASASSRCGLWINHIDESFHNRQWCCIVDVKLFQKAPIGTLVPISGSHPGGGAWEHWAFLPNR